MSDISRSSISSFFDTAETSSDYNSSSDEEDEENEKKRRLKEFTDQIRETVICLLIFFIVLIIYTGIMIGYFIIPLADGSKENGEKRILYGNVNLEKMGNNDIISNPIYTTCWFNQECTNDNLSFTEERRMSAVIPRTSSIISIIAGFSVVYSSVVSNKAAKDRFMEDVKGKFSLSSNEESILRSCVDCVSEYEVFDPEDEDNQDYEDGVFFCVGECVFDVDGSDKELSKKLYCESSGIWTKETIEREATMLFKEACVEIDNIKKQTSRPAGILLLENVDCQYEKNAKLSELYQNCYSL